MSWLYNSDIATAPADREAPFSGEAILALDSGSSWPLPGRPAVSGSLAASAGSLAVPVRRDALSHLSALIPFSRTLSRLLGEASKLGLLSSRVPLGATTQSLSLIHI